MRLLRFLIIICLVLSSCGRKGQEIHDFKTSVFVRENVIPIVGVDFGGGMETKMIIDTGSDISMIDRSYYERNRNLFSINDSSTLRIRTANGEYNEITYSVNALVNDSIPVTLYVMDMENMVNTIFIRQQVFIDGLLGVDFLYGNKLVLDFSNKTLSNF